MPFAFPIVLAVLAAATLLFAPPRQTEAEVALGSLALEAPLVEGVLREPDRAAEGLVSAVATRDQASSDPGAPEPSGGDVARLPAETVEAPVPGAQPAALLMPVEGVLVADVWPSFGDPRGGGSRSHAGVDIVAPRGSPVRPAAAGTVWRAGESRNGGISVTLIGDDGARYFYAHLDALAPGLERGARVGVDDVIGYVGNTGNAAGTSPHLHFEAALPDEGREWSWTPVDPLPLLQDRSPAYP